MAHAGRRSTLASIDGNNQNGFASAIPVPSSAVKPVKTLGASTGLSMHPGAARQSMMPRASLAPGRAPGFAGGASASQGGLCPAGSQGMPRASILPQHYSQYDELGYPSSQVTTPHHLNASGRRGDAGIYGGRQSIAPVSAGRPSVAHATPSSRRSIGRTSMAPGSLPGYGPPIKKDTRPVNDRNFRNVMEERLGEFIRQTNFSIPGLDTTKRITEPTQSSFVGMFKHIYAECIDPKYTFGLENKKFEEEVIMLMREARYPFADELSKTRLQAAGSRTNWPPILAMLDWMINLGTQAAMQGAGPLERPEDEEDDMTQEGPDMSRLFFPFLWKCYAKFWDNQDAYPEELGELEAQFQRRNMNITDEIERLEKEKAKLANELSSYTDKDSPLVKEQKENEVLEGDMSKFTKYHDEILQPKLEKSKRVIGKLKDALQETGDELQKKEKERAVLQEQVDRQEMSSEDFERMTSERDKLHKQLADLAEATAKASNASWRLELAAGSKQNHVEGQLNEFNTRAHGVHLLPLELPSGDLLHELELAPANPETMLPPGIDIRGAVRPAIQHLRQGEAEKRKQLSDVCLSCQEDLDDLLETLERGRENVAGIEARLDAVKEQLDDANATGQQETTNFSAEHSKQESNLHQIEHAGRIAVQQAELRLSQLRIQLQQATENAEAHRKVMHDEIYAALQMLLELKESVGEGLNKLEDTVRRESDD